MPSLVETPIASAPRTATANRYLSVREQTVALCEALAPEDTVVQSMPDVSPTKWHLAHTTWFFERFLLEEHAKGYREFAPAFDHLFNSYYHTVGEMFSRPHRGLLSRPTLAEVLQYRRHVDRAVLELIEGLPEVGASHLEFLITLGLNHEQQHQELLLTDIKHVFSVNPLEPVFHEAPPRHPTPAPDLVFVKGPSGLLECGAGQDSSPPRGQDAPARASLNQGDHAQDNAPDFHFDNETPRHQVLVRPHALANRPITNGEFREFVQDDAYQTSSLWLADAWTAITTQGWARPFYWSEDLTSEFTLNGRCELDPNAPVSHVSFYEADAFARWAGARLPTEFELELALAATAVDGNFVESEQFHPRPAIGGAGLQQLYGDVWEWTASPYAPYPGFMPLSGSLGEYNGKFMCSQLVLRGGSCASPRSHLRPTYRNFFYPDARWQFSGIRLARDD